MFILEKTLNAATFYSLLKHNQGLISMLYIYTNIKSGILNVFTLKKISLLNQLPATKQILY